MKASSGAGRERDNATDATPIRGPRSVRVTEADHQAAVVELARLLGWRVVHFRPARTSKGWRTPVAYDATGFPDLVLVRDRLVVAELKGTGGRLRPEQRAWLDALRAAGVEAHLWGPDDWDDIRTTLTHRS